MGHTSLLVVPTSLVFNWQREIRRFTPGLSVYQFTGPNRTRSITKLVNYDIVITTYGVLRNDIDLLKDVRFNYIVLDESQTIKNPSSKVYRSAMLLKAKHFISLSGTPIENSLTDLWAQINFLNRGMLGTLKTFKEEYIQPIEKNNDEQIKRLKEIVKPFIFRRTKQEVAPELPELNEQVVYCNLSDEQKTIYETEKSTIRNQIIENISALGYNKSAISIFRGLTRLRQIANHPQMLEDYKSADSGKFEEITRTIETLVEENHRILVFSSFVKHLRIIEQYLKKNSIGYQMLIGSTTNRQQVVDKFQNNSSSNVFLISIKAGGVGLNLTAADYILVLDPWWNPAVENQAIARAHRIGQDKKVFVYRFISVETVEEKIQKLQEKKLLLSQEFIDNANPLSVISKDQIIEFLS
jgi:SNF2 family DNA or RNA helicase